MLLQHDIEILLGLQFYGHVYILRCKLLANTRMFKPGITESAARSSKQNRIPIHMSISSNFKIDINIYAVVGALCI